MCQERIACDHDIRARHQNTTKHNPESVKKYKEFFVIFRIKNSETRQGGALVPIKRRWNAPDTALISIAEFCLFFIAVFY